MKVSFAKRATIYIAGPESLPDGMHTQGGTAEIELDASVLPKGEAQVDVETQPVVALVQHPVEILVIPVSLKGRRGSYTHSMFLDDESAIAGGRELWGFPKKLACPSFKVEKDTLRPALRMRRINSRDSSRQLSDSAAGMPVACRCRAWSKPGAMSPTLR